MTVREMIAALEALNMPDALVLQAEKGSRYYERQNDGWETKQVYRATDTDKRIDNGWRPLHGDEMSGMTIKTGVIIR